MLQVFDLAIIGAGPAGYAALTALQGYSGSVAMITGSVPYSSQVGHGKICSVAYERQKGPSIGERARTKDGRGEVFATAEIGGLSNYWGQQLQRYRAKDPWGRSQFVPTWQAYCSACSAVENDLVLSGGAEAGDVETNDGMYSQSPRLLVGTRKLPNAGLDSISEAISDRITAMPGVNLISARVNRIEAACESVKIIVSDGESIYARRVLLASGVPGSAGILSRSLPLVKEAYFSDHAPHMLLAFGLSRLLDDSHNKRVDHFNSLSLLKNSDDHTTLFASVYRLSGAPLSLLTTMLGIGAFGRGMTPPTFIDFMRPIQVWTLHTVSRCTYWPAAEIVDFEEAKRDTDNELRNMQEWLRRNRVPVKLLSTPPGQGFHYHRLELSTGQGKSVSVDKVLSDAFERRVTCIDASVLQEIGCMPHTLTAMAQGYARVRSLSGLT